MSASWVLLNVLAESDPELCSFIDLLLVDIFSRGVHHTLVGTPDLGLETRMLWLSSAECHGCRPPGRLRWNDQMSLLSLSTQNCVELYWFIIGWIIIGEVHHILTPDLDLETRMLSGRLWYNYPKYYRISHIHSCNHLTLTLKIGSVGCVIKPPDRLYFEKWWVSHPHSHA